VGICWQERFSSFLYFYLIPWPFNGGEVFNLIGEDLRSTFGLTVLMGPSLSSCSFFQGLSPGYPDGWSRWYRKTILPISNVPSLTMLMVLKSHDGNEITGLWISITIAFKFSTI
jgi:hypothetical protein